MKTFIFKAINNSSVRGFNREIIVYRLKNNQPSFVGCNDEINTASYKGDHAVAAQIIADNTSHKMDARGYDLVSKQIKIISI